MKTHLWYKIQLGILAAVMTILSICALPVQGKADAGRVAQAFASAMSPGDDGAYFQEWEDSIQLTVLNENYIMSVSYNPDTNDMVLDAYKKPGWTGASKWHFTLAFQPCTEGDWEIQHYYDNFQSLDTAAFNPRTLVPEKQFSFSGKGASGDSAAAHLIMQRWFARMRDQFGLSAADLGFSVYEGYQNDNDEPDPNPDENEIPATATDVARNIIRYVTAHRQTDSQDRPCVTEQISVGRMFSDQITCRIAYDRGSGTLIFTGEWKMAVTQAEPHCVRMEYNAAEDTVHTVEYRAGKTITAAITKDYRIGDDLFFMDQNGNLSGLSNSAQVLTEHAAKAWNEILGKGGYGLADLGFTGFTNTSGGGNRDYPETDLIRYLRDSGKLTRITHQGTVYYTATAEFIDDQDYDNEDQIVLRCSVDEEGYLTYVLTCHCRTGSVNTLRLERNMLQEIQQYDEPIDPDTFTKDTDLVYHVIWGTGLSADYTNWREAMQYMDELLHEHGFSLADLGLHAYENSLHGEDKIQDFVRRCYSLILGREADGDGLASWTEALKSGSAAAANIIDGFVRSDEFIQRNLSNDEKVEIMYRTMLNREADGGGKASWVSVLDMGYPMQNIIDGFCGSEEFTKLCREYGIEPGSVNAAPPADSGSPRGKIEAFVRRCYQLILSREADQGGLTGWSDALESRTAPAARIIEGFVASVEYTNRNLSPDQSVDILYRTMLGREADEGGKAGWVDALSKGYTFQHIINGFCGSAEFTKICSDYGIEAGSVAVPVQSAAALEAAAQLEAKKLPDERIGNAVSADDTGITVVNGYEPAEVEAFVKHAYRAALGREADEAGLAGWTEQIVSGAAAPKAFLRTLLGSNEFAARNLSSEALVETLYRLYLNRGMDDAAADRVAQLAAGGLDEVIKGFEGSAEFRLVLNGFGL